MARHRTRDLRQLVAPQPARMAPVARGMARALPLAMARALPLVIARALPLVMTLLAMALLAGCNSGRNQAPALGNVYSQSLADYWAQVAAFAGIDPAAGFLHEWKVVYGQDGTVQLGRLSFLTGSGAGAQWYTIYERRGETEVSRSEVEQPVRDVLRAATFFRELDAVGLRELEQHAGVSHPVELDLHTVHIGGSTTGAAEGHLIQDGRIVTPGEQPVTVGGGIGTLYVTSRGYSGPLADYTYLIPSAFTP